MSEDPSRVNPPKNEVSGDLDLRGIKPGEARSRAFSGMFKFKPGQRICVLVDTDEAEKEIMLWIGEAGHRFLKGATREEKGRKLRSLEIVKMEARR